MSRGVPHFGLRLDIERKRMALAQRAYAGHALVPERLDRRAELPQASDQGDTPRCAAYTMAGWLEFNRWRDTGVCEQIDPDPIYERAKRIDKLEGDGTTLEAVWQASIDLGLLESDISALRVVESQADARRALHRNGVLVAGFEIDEGWMDARPDGWITSSGNVLGGHAVLLCGYDLRPLDDRPFWTIQNSWGHRGYGWRGFCRIAPEIFERQFVYGIVW